MRLTRKSLSEDNVDYYTNTLAFVMMMVLAFVTLFITLSPTYLIVREISEMGFEPKDSNDIAEATPHYTAQCWVPPEFTQAMTAYTNTICSGAVNSLAQGKETETKIYRSDGGAEADALGVDDFGAGKDKASKKRKLQMMAIEKHLGDVKIHLLKYTKNLRLHLTEVTSFNTPFLLFIVAICLKLPFILHSLLSTCCGGINVDGTLASTQEAVGLGPAVWQRLKQDILMSLSRSSKRTTSILYLLMKVLMVATLWISAVAVNMKGLKKVNQMEAVGKQILSKSGEFLKTSKILEASMIQGMQRPHADILQHTYSCEFEKRTLQNVQSFTVECVFGLQGGEGVGAGKGLAVAVKSDDVHVSETMAEEAIIIFIYKSLFAIVILLYVGLAGLNSLSLIGWFCRLCVPSIGSMCGRNSDYISMDHVFLVRMAQVNVSGVVAMELAQKESDGYNGDGVEMQMLKGGNSNVV